MDTEFFSYQQGLYRANSELIPELLDALWSHDQIRLRIETWMESKALTQVADGVSDEFEAAKAQFFMYSNQVTPEFVMAWPFDEEMKKACHNMLKWNRISEAATERKMAEDKNHHCGTHLVSIVGLSLARCSPVPKGRNIVMAQVLHLQFQTCSKLQTILSLFASANGASRQMIDFLNHASLSVSYTTLQNINVALADRSVYQVAILSFRGHSMAYDNYNAKSSIFIKQFFNGMSKVQSGMFTLIYLLQFVEDPNHLLLTPILKRFKTSTDVTLADIHSHVNQMASYCHQTQVTLLNILMKYVEGFSYLKDSSAIWYKARCQLASTPKTEFYPLHMATIEEATIEGNLHVHEDAYIDQMRCNPDSLGTMAIPLYADQLTLSHAHSCQLERLGDMTPWSHCNPFQTYVGKFHMDMNYKWGIRHKHYGAAKQLRSLSYYFVLLEKKWLAGEKPDFHTLSAAYDQMLDGLVLNAWRVKCRSLEEFTKSKPSARELLQQAADVFDEFGTPMEPTIIEDNDSSDKDNDNNQPGQDNIALATTSDFRAPNNPDDDPAHQNVRLLVWDLLYACELSLAISIRDVGQIEDILADSAAIFRGCGSNKYVMEIVHLLFNLKQVWPTEFVFVIFLYAVYTDS